MSFKGDLSTIGLGEVFQMISMSQKEGTLVVQDSDSRKNVFFGATGVELLSSGKRKGLRVGDMLVRSGKITEGQLEEALESGRIQKKMVGEILVESGAVSQDEIRSIVREQIEEEIYDLFLWKKADFEFVEGPAADNLRDPEARVTKLAFDVNGLLLEAVRRADEWAVISQTIPSIDSIFTFVSDSDRHEEEKSANDHQRRITRLIDGRMPISEIVENTGISRFETCKVILDLTNRGRIRVLTVSETMELAVKRMAEGQRERGLRMYLAAAAMAPNDAKVLAQVARFLEGEGLAKEAAGYHVKAGRLFLEKGDLDRAMDHMQRAASGNPDNPDTQMGLFEVHAASGNLTEGKRLASDLVMTALMAPDLPRARALCDRILAADPADLQFRIYRAKSLHRANLKKELAEDLEFIKQNMPTDLHEIERINGEMKEFLVKPSTAHAKPKSGTGQAPKVPKAKLRAKLKPIVAAVLVLLVGAGGFFAMTERSARAELDGLIAASRKAMENFAFAEARRGVDAFISKTLSPGQRSRGRDFLLELESKQQTWEKDKKDKEDKDRREALIQMEGMAAAIEQDRATRPGTALQRARELREIAEKHKDADFMRRAEELAATLEKYIGDAFQLKTRADTLEKEGKLRDAALLVDRLLTEYPNTDAARGALYPIEIVTRPPGVRVTSTRSGVVLGETPLRYRMTPTEAVRLVFEKAGYSSVERDVKDKSVGRFQVELLDKREQWLIPLGFSITSEPAVLGDALFVGGGSRLYSLKTNPRRLLWFESLDGTIEGGPKAGADRVYAGTAGSSVVAIDPAAEKRVAWKYEAGDRVSGTPGLSADGTQLYAVTYDRILHAINAKTGASLWKRELPADSRVEPLVVDGLLIVACSEGTLLALKGPRPEDEVWRYRLDGMPGPLLYEEGVIYVTGSDQTAHALDPKRGQRIWRRVLPSAPTGRMGRVGATVAAAGRDGKVYFLDAATGESAWTFEAQGPIQGGVAVAGSLILFGSDDQSVYAFDVSLRSLAWRLKCKGRVRVAPVVAQKYAFFGTDEGLYAVELN